MVTLAGRAKLAALVVFSGVGLSGCLMKSPPPAVFTDYATNVQIAQVLAAGCPNVAVDQAGMGAGARELGTALRAEGYTPEDISAFPDTLDVGAIQASTQAYLTQNGIDPQDSTTVCPVAKREIDNNTAIAAFLDAV
ncbi:DUF5333 family protein [Meridianimarinicoccus aquatilis]|uniref:Uncharacterized protein n=1 Tax=Meridianimarinicoccus aquatilis TaxID=2552766 RepID=A0A4R6B413_9RHOB|nr:DUF5333 family protein [Fluviibacterium aquatile]QIE40597.1 DUF5333 domain-containing protein [Rhodobacteraceae bacterium SC52]TDL91105.1 hypothetical protein E2L05_02180 [Fluviibacterium aquatile]